MFPSKAKNEKRVVAVMDLFGGKERGETVTHEEIEAVAGIDRQYTDYYKLVLRARRRLMNGGGAWSWELPGVGYRLLTADETLTKEPERRARRARRQIVRGSRACQCLDDRDLTPLQRRQKEAAIGHAEDLQRQLAAKERADAQAARMFRSPLAVRAD